jgi:ribosomal protein L40E
MKCFNCGAKNPHEEEIEGQGHRRLTITICIECGAAWNAITLAAIVSLANGARTHIELDRV